MLLACDSFYLFFLIQNMWPSEINDYLSSILTIVFFFFIQYTEMDSTVSVYTCMCMLFHMPVAFRTWMIMALDIFVDICINHSKLCMTVNPQLKQLSERVTTKLLYSNMILLLCPINAKWYSPTPESASQSIIMQCCCFWRRCCIFMHMIF